MRLHVGLALGPTRRDRPPAPRHRRATTSTPTDRRLRLPVDWGHTTRIPGRVTPLIASKPAPVTMSTRRASRARLLVPLARTTTLLGRPRPPIASMHSRATTSLTPVQPHRALASLESFSHRPGNPRASMPIPATMLIHLLPPAKRPALLARTSLPTRRRNATRRMRGTTLRPLALLVKLPAIQGHSTRSRDRWPRPTA